MAYPDRIAVRDPDTPTIDLIMRKVTLGEGPIPSGYGSMPDGALYNPDSTHAIGFKSGLWLIPVGYGATLFDANYLSVIGFSKNGWGRLSYLNPPFTSAGFSIFGWTKGAVLTTVGGPGLTLQPLGLYEYQVSKDYTLTAFDGGDFTFTPAPESIIVDWGIATGNGPVSGYTGPSYEAPLSTVGSPAIFQSYRYEITFDPDNISSLVTALEIRDNAGVLELNTKILYDVPTDGAYIFRPAGAIWTSPDTTGEVNWAIDQLQDVTQLAVLTSFEYVPMWPTVGVIGTPVCTHFTPLMAFVDAGNFDVNGIQFYVGRDGFIFNKFGTWWLATPDWTTYQALNFVAGEEAWCTAVGFGNIRVLQDTDGTFLILTFDPDTEEATLWTSGEIEPGFDGCGGPPPPAVIPPPPTIVTGDVILRAWPLSLDAHDMYVLRLGLTETQIYDKLSKQWFPWSSFSNAIWAVNTGFEWLGGVGIGATNIIVGDDTTGTLYFLDPEQPYDEPQTEEADPQQIYFDRIVMGQCPIRGREVLPCYAIFVTGDMGQPAYDGAGVTLYTSDDAGETWDDQGLVVITAGMFEPELLWTSLGQIAAPGRLFMLIDDGALTRIDGMEMNDPDDA
jgi:hypothetical protein